MLNLMEWNYASGIYFYEIGNQNYFSVKKMILMK